MVRYFLMAIWVLTFNVNYGQSLSSVEGSVVEISSQDPLEFVNIVLKKLPDSLFVQNTISDSNGAFIFHMPGPGQYVVEASLIGFELKRSAAFELKEGDRINMGFLPLSPSDFLLNEVQVTAANPSFVAGIDRRIYYPQNDIQARSGSATDILQNIPSISVEAEGEILLRGSGNITFLLNGKPSALLKNNSTAILEQIPAHTIERIEIITNPSAKYKPDGTAGIINIVTKKNVLPGFNGSILASASTQGRYNGNISMNYNPGKVNISALYGYWQSYSPRTYTDFRNIRDSLSEDETIFDLKSISTSKPISHTATLGLDYQPDKKNSLGISGSYRDFNSKRESEDIVLEYNFTGTFSQYTTNRYDGDDESGVELNMYAEHLFDKKGHHISIEAQFGNDDEVENSGFSDQFTFPLYPEYKGRTSIHNKGNGTSILLEYINPLSETVELEAGYEGDYSNGDLDFFSEYFDFAGQSWKNDILKSNRFLYRQDIHAVYATLSKSIESLGILAGLRAEQTNLESDLINLDSVIPNSYFKLFPTLHLTYELGDEQELGLSYSRRVNRPDADELNPFPEYVNIRDIEAGNPHLKPEQIHSIELGYHFNKDEISFLPTLYYRQTFDAFSEVTRYINDSTLLTTLENLDKEVSGGLELIFSWTPSGKFNLNLNSNLFYHTIDDSNTDERSIVTANTKLAAFINLFPSTKLQLNTTYRSSRLTSQGRSLPVYFINAGLNQDLFRKKASLTLTVSDIFNTMRWKYIIDTPILYQVVTRKRKSQIVYLGFSYHFGINNKKNGEELIFDDRI